MVEHRADCTRSAAKSMGLATGFRDLDRLTSGLHDGNLISLRRAPFHGQDGAGDEHRGELAVDRNIPVGVFSLEMSSGRNWSSACCARGRGEPAHASRRIPSERDFHPLTAAASQLMKAPLFIDDSASLSVNQVRARARRMKQQYDIRLLVIDYMQLMRAPSRRADLSRQVEIADISTGVKALAKELKIPIIVLSQLNRQPEAREGGRPKLSDLRESGAIEQDADVVGLLVRPEVYAEEEGDKAAEKGKAILVIAKQRNGPTGDVNLTFLSEYTRFEDQALVNEEDIPGSQGGEE